MILQSLLLAALAATSSGEEVVARVDGTVITRAALERRIDAFASRGTPIEAAPALDTLVVEVLLAAEGRRAGLADSPVFKAWVAAELKRAAARALTDSFAARAEPDEAALREMFHASADFVRYESLTWATEKDARAALARIEGGATMEAEAKGAIVARLASTSPSDVRFAMRAQLQPQLAAALFAAAPGKVVGPVPDDAGFSLARVVSKEIGTEKDFAARKASLAANARNQGAEAARQHVLEQLRARAQVKIDEAFLKSADGSPSPEQLAHVIATVDGSPIRYADIYDQLRGIGVSAGHMATGVRLQFARNAVDERLLQNAAVARGYDKRPEVVARRAELERNGLAALYAEKLQATVPAPSGREVERYYDGNASRFGKPLAQVRAAVASEAKAAKQKAALDARVDELRKRASVSVDASALARVPGARG